MKAIKKIAITPIDNNDGNIIDSMNTTDNIHINAPSINAIKIYVDDNDNTKQNTVLHGTTEPANSLGVDGDIYLQHN